MQSAARAIKRGNAVIYYDQVLERHELIRRHGTPKKLWKFWRHIQNSAEQLKKT